MPGILLLTTHFGSISLPLLYSISRALSIGVSFVHIVQRAQELHDPLHMHPHHTSHVSCLCHSSAHSGQFLSEGVFPIVFLIRFRISYVSIQSYRPDQSYRTPYPCPPPPEIFHPRRLACKCHSSAHSGQFLSEGVFLIVFLIRFRMSYVSMQSYRPDQSHMTPYPCHHFCTLGDWLASATAQLTAGSFWVKGCFL